ncbi:MAG: tRNA1(Val) (adenine(37)-N6)-methyltransferase [Lactobacillales bacterium]|jgi:tRNA1(Val) A37 N6-methylase TrmN6|nr:tRNA1(Val) (adenine(37)-N6)-methyltransferase [Lactobacillales bacterium]
MVELYSDERVDQLFANDIQVIQSPTVFSYSVDSVLLANFPSIPKHGKIVDLCAGNGAVGLFVSRYTKAPITQVELQPRLADMGRRSIALNHLEEQMTMRTMDLKDIPSSMTHDSVDLLLVNPPYFKQEAASKKNPNPYLAIARHEITANLEDVVRVSAFLLKTNGRIAMVHRPDRLLDILDTFKKYKIAPKRIQFVYPKAGKEANTILIEGIKNGSTDGLRILPPLIIHDESGEYTPEVWEKYYGRK